MAEQCRAIVSQTRHTVKNTLSEIKALDQQVIIKNYHAATLKIDLLLRVKELSLEEQKEIIKQIDELDDEINQLSEKKVRLSNSLYSSVTSSCQEVNLLFSEYWKKQKKTIERQAADQTDLELGSLLAQCKLVENQQFCCCSLKKKMELCDQTMILCEKEDCPHRWYHISCAGLNQNQAPDNWICSMCKLGLLLSETTNESET